MTDAFASSTPAGDRQVTISDSAAARLAQIFEAEDKPSMMLRVSVSGGGCSGFQYGFDFEESIADDDRVFERDGVKVVIDETSLDLLAGSEIDYATEMVGSAFKVNNPNATAGCGCGASFSI